MAILSVNLNRGSRTSDFTVEGGTAVREYQVISDGNDNELTIPLAIGLPTYGTPHPSNGSFTCKTLSVREREPDSKQIWIVTATFDQKPLDNKNENNPSRNPLLERGTFRVASSSREEIMEEDADGDPILNPVGDPVRGVTREIADYIIVITKNLATLSTAAMTAAHEQAVFSGTFFGATDGQPRLTRLEAELLFHPECGDYFATTWEVTCRNGGWDREVINEGFYELNDDTPAKRVAITVPAFNTDTPPKKVDDVFVTEPHPLTAAGKRLPEGDAPNFITVKRYKKTDPSTLGIPTTFAEL